MNLRAYFSHPLRSPQDGKERIIEILQRRKVEVVDPFILDNDICSKYGQITYEENCIRKLGRDIWIKDLNEIKRCNLFVVWLPDNISTFGCAAELQFALEWQKEKRSINRILRQKCGTGFNRKDEPYLIQMITKRKNPLIAYAIDYGNQLFETIDDFEHLRLTRWD